MNEINDFKEINFDSHHPKDIELEEDLSFEPDSLNPKDIELGEDSQFDSLKSVEEEPKSSIRENIFICTAYCFIYAIFITIIILFLIIIILMINTIRCYLNSESC